MKNKAELTLRRKKIKKTNLYIFKNQSNLFKVKRSDFGFTRSNIYCLPAVKHFLIK